MCRGYVWIGDVPVVIVDGSDGHWGHGDVGGHDVAGCSRADARGCTRGDGRCGIPDNLQACWVRLGRNYCRASKDILRKYNVDRGYGSYSRRGKHLRPHIDDASAINASFSIGTTRAGVARRHVDRILERPRPAHIESPAE